MRGAIYSIQQSCAKSQIGARKQNGSFGVLNSLLKKLRTSSKNDYTTRAHVGRRRKAFAAWMPQLSGRTLLAGQIEVESCRQQDGCTKAVQETTQSRQAHLLSPSDTNASRTRLTQEAPQFATLNKLCMEFSLPNVGALPYVQGDSAWMPNSAACALLAVRVTLKLLVPSDAFRKLFVVCSL